MNELRHKNCGGNISYCKVNEKAYCDKCEKYIAEVEELLNEISIMKLDDSEVISVSMVKENQ